MSNPVLNFGVGVVGSASFLPAAASYGAGSIIDVAKQFTFTYANGEAIQPGALIRVLSAVTKINQTAIISGETSYSLALYSGTPPSAQADQATWTLASGDLASYRGTLSLGFPVDLGAACYIKTGSLDHDVNLNSGGIFARLITAGAFTATAVARQIILYGTVL